MPSTPEMPLNPSEIYRQTVLDFDDGPAIDLRAPLGPQERTSLARAAGGGPLAVITAANPGRMLGVEENALRHRALLEALERKGVDWVRVLGCSPDGEHCEESVCASLSLAEAVDLARSFGQEAIFWYDGSSFWLVGVGAATGRVRLPVGAGEEGAGPSAGERTSGEEQV